MREAGPRGSGDDGARGNVPADSPARVAAILGWPLGHSLSPRLFARAFALRGIPFRYDALATPPAELASAVRALRRRSDLAGFNVTIPHKRTIVPLLDEVDGEAEAVGAVNCVTAGGAALRGTNTDARGFAEALAGEGAFEARGRAAVVLGAGGAARAVVHALRGAGAARITVLARRPERAAELDAVGAASAGAREAIAAADLLVNATPAGMTGGGAEDALPLVGADVLREELLVCDLVYAPLETPLLRAARERGARVMGGLPMLARQAAIAFRLWTGQPMDGREMLALAEELVAQRS